MEGWLPGPGRETVRAKAAAHGLALRHAVREARDGAWLCAAAGRAPLGGHVGDLARALLPKIDPVRRRWVGRCRLDDGRDAFLRLYAPGAIGKSLRNVLAARALGAHGIPIARTLAQGWLPAGGRPHFVIVKECRDAQPLLHADLEALDIERLGVEVGRWRLAGRPRRHPRVPRSRSDADRSVMLRTAARLIGKDMPAVAALLRQDAAALDMIAERRPRWPAHNDPNPGNVLVDAAGAVTWIDLDEVSRAPFAAMLATIEQSWFPGVPHLLDGFVAGVFRDAPEARARWRRERLLHLRAYAGRRLARSLTRLQRGHPGSALPALHAYLATRHVEDRGQSEADLMAEIVARTHAPDAAAFPDTSGLT